VGSVNRNILGIKKNQFTYFVVFLACHSQNMCRQHKDHAGATDHNTHRPIPSGRRQCYNALTLGRTACTVVDKPTAFRTGCVFPEATGGGGGGGLLSETLRCL
jgi:hypothetical protein